MKIKLESVANVLKGIIFALIMIGCVIILVLEPTYVCKETANFCMTYLMHILLLTVIPFSIIQIRLLYKMKPVDNS